MLTLTLEESDHELLDGFPEYIEFLTNLPSTVYYTLDGTAPGEDSLIAVGKVYLPTTQGIVVLKAVAISGEDSSEILYSEYKNTSENLGGPRLLGKEGISVMRQGDSEEDSLGYLEDGTKGRLLSEQASSFDIKASKTNSLGEEIERGKTSYDKVNFEIKQSISDKFSRTSPNNNVNFDASAKYIIIDGTTDESRQNQVVKIVNRPYNTFGPTTNFYKERMGQKEPIVTGNYVRSFYNPKTKKYVSFYWESLESRWIRSEQIVERESLDTSNPTGGRHVYKWIQDRALSQLF